MNWHGPHGRGALKAHREKKRAEAEERNFRTPVAGRAWHREGRLPMPPGKRAPRKVPA